MTSEALVPNVCVRSGSQLGPERRQLKVTGTFQVNKPTLTHSNQDIVRAFLALPVGRFLDLWMEANDVGYRSDPIPSSTNENREQRAEFPHDSWGELVHVGKVLHCVDSPLPTDA